MNASHVHLYEHLPTHNAHILQVIATYTQESETSPAKGSPEEMSTSYEEGARSFPHIPDDEPMKDAPRKRPPKKVGHEHMFHQKVSSYEFPQMMEWVIYI